jgi:hypothetical protein
MNNIKAQIAHYDYRSNEEVNDNLSKSKDTVNSSGSDDPVSKDDTKDNLDF